MLSEVSKSETDVMISFIRGIEETTQTSKEGGEIRKQTLTREDKVVMMEGRWVGDSQAGDGEEGGHVW